MITKTALRKQIKELKQMHAASSKQQSEAILAVLEASPAFRTATTLLLYHSLPDEVFTHSFIRRWSQKKELLLPVVVGDELELRRYTSPADLKIGAYGIEEPTGELFTDYNKIDLAIIPGVAFDRKGNRLGRGKGYYDRLLPLLRNCHKIGICFAYQLVEEVPTEPFDIQMDEVITN